MMSCIRDLENFNYSGMIELRICRRNDGNKSLLNKDRSNTVQLSDHDDVSKSWSRNRNCQTQLNGNKNITVKYEFRVTTFPMYSGRHRLTTVMSEIRDLNAKERNRLPGPIWVNRMQRMMSDVRDTSVEIQNIVSFGEFNGKDGSLWIESTPSLIQGFQLPPSLDDKQNSCQRRNFVIQSGENMQYANLPWYVALQVWTQRTNLCWVFSHVTNYVIIWKAAK